MADLPFIGKSDLEILKSLTLANQINLKYSSNLLQTGSDIEATLSSEDAFASEAEYRVTSSLSRSDCTTSAYNLFKFDSEYETMCHDVNCVNTMCDLFIEKNQHLEAQIFSLIKDASPIAQEIISPKHLYEVVEQINNTVEHIVLICDKMYRIQQVLQEKSCERTLKVNPSCQRAVLKFFTIANEIMDKVQQQVENTENYQSKSAVGIESHHKELQSRLHNKMLELAKRIDIISQFRDKLLPTSIQNSASTSNLDILLS